MKFPLTFVSKTGWKKNTNAYIGEVKTAQLHETGVKQEKQNFREFSDKMCGK